MMNNAVLNEAISPNFKEIINNQRYKDIELVNNNEVCISPLILPIHAKKVWEEKIGALLADIYNLHKNYSTTEEYFNALSLPAEFVELFKYIKIFETEAPVYRIARPDFFYDDNHLRILELNVTSSIGGLLTDLIFGKAHFSAASMEGDIDYEKPYSALEHLVDIYKLKDYHVIISDQQKYFDKYHNYYSLLQNELSKLGVSNEIISFENLSIAEMICAPCKKLLFRFFNCFDMETAGFYKEIYKKFRGNVFIPISQNFYSIKNHLALLSELSDKGVIPGCHTEILPWTRVLRHAKTIKDGKTIDLIDYSSMEKNKLVLKPAWGFGGEGVKIGNQCSQIEWDSLIQEHSTSNKYVLQEYYDPGFCTFIKHDCAIDSTRTVQAKTLFAAFFADQKYIGNYLRISEKNGVINASTGMAVTSYVLFKK